MSKLKTHHIGGERSCLIGADDRGAPERLYASQAADDGMALGHLSRAEGEAGGDHGGEALCRGKGKGVDMIYTRGDGYGYKLWWIYIHAL